MPSANDSRTDLALVIAPLRRWLSARAPRERQMMLIAVMAVALAAALTATDWILAERERLQKRLPLARAVFERMQADTDELTRLRALPASPAPEPATLVAAVRSAALARGLQLEIRATPDGLSASGHAALPDLIDWLAAMQGDLHLYPVRLRTGSAPGRPVEVLLARVGGAPAGNGR
ncbi:type II secretion system protein M [Azoarcus sp. L1K30]|uniref:type II secretion system protein GspM n=1 Tax=Azoarcus sp. L1K30 TaxID=2820277 RepID=UPI001B8115C0|nr:type II secretion system protein GspM [Azoarcus sp. L1K30]MBR0565821.1 type II secretion system protein M [Azoarcus sp. L1K30]